jgi:alpha-tubulin suppressor-like RCC1 family protein
MTQPGNDGKYEVSKTFSYKKERNKQGEWELTENPDLDLMKEHFLKPKHILWQCNPSLKRSVISVAIGRNHLVVAARDPGLSVGKVYTSGVNAYGQLGLGDEGKGTDRHALTLVCEHKHIFLS